MLAAILHEAGHLAAIKIENGGIKRVDIMPLGARIVTSGTLSHKSDIKIYLSGPFANLIAFSVFFLPAVVFRQPYLMYFSFANLLLSLVNLLPLAGNDGYCAYLAWCSDKYGEGGILKSANIVEALSKWAFFCLSLLAVLLSGFNPGVIGLTAAANIYKKH